MGSFVVWCWHGIDHAYPVSHLLPAVGIDYSLYVGFRTEEDLVPGSRFLLGVSGSLRFDAPSMGNSQLCVDGRVCCDVLRAWGRSLGAEQH